MCVFPIIEKYYFATAMFPPCFVSFCFELVMTKLVLLHFFQLLCCLFRRAGSAAVRLFSCRCFGLGWG